MKINIVVIFIISLFILNGSISYAARMTTKMGIGSAAYGAYKAAKNYKKMKKAAENNGYSLDPNKNKKYAEDMMNKIKGFNSNSTVKTPNNPQKPKEKIVDFVKRQLLID